MEEKEKTEEVKKKGVISKLTCLIGKCMKIFVPGVILALILFVAVEAALVPTSQNSFCGELCHEMDTAYESYKEGPHFKNSSGIEVKCISCHLPPKEDEYFNHLYQKALTGTKDAYKHVIGAEFNVEEASKKVLEHFENKTCLHCHNNLLGNPENELVAEIHEEVLNPPEGAEQEKCVDCHDDAGHVKD